MHYPRLFLAAASLGILVQAVPASAATGDISSIMLRDFNHNGKIDRAVVTFANPSKSTWSVRGMSGMAIVYTGTVLKISDAFIASSSDPAVLEIVLDESQEALPVDTDASHFEVSYRPVGAAQGVSDGAAELAAIDSGDTGPADIELDQAAPILVASTPEPGAVDVLRTDGLAVTFSEPVQTESLVLTSSVNPGGWLLTPIGDGHAVSIQHDAYPRATTETFGMAAKDLSGNALVTNGYPNPFSFQTSSGNTPNPRVDPVFQMTSPSAGATIWSGEPTLLAWYTNMPDAATTRLSYSTDGGQTWKNIAVVSSSQKGYLWYPPQLPGAVQLKAEARDANENFVNVSTVGPVFVGTGSHPFPLAVLSGPNADLSGTTLKLSLRATRLPATAVVSCNDGAVRVPVQMTGDRPGRLEANLSDLTMGTMYACAFILTDENDVSQTLSISPFAAGDDRKAPELQGPAVIDAFDPAAGTARLNWTTDEPSAATVSYGVYLNYGSAAEHSLSTAHQVTLSGLVPGKIHQARITSIDAKGNAGVSKDYYFVFLREGDLIKGSGPAVYWYQNGARRVFPHLDTYRSWFGNDFSKVLRVPDTQLGTIPLGGNVRMRENVYLLKIQSDPKTYAVEPEGKLRWIQSESQALALYGTAWAKRVRDVDVSLFTDYTIGAPLTENERPAGY